MSCYPFLCNGTVDVIIESSLNGIKVQYIPSPIDCDDYPDSTLVGVLNSFFCDGVVLGPFLLPCHDI